MSLPQELRTHGQVDSAVNRLNLRTGSKGSAGDAAVYEAFHAPYLDVLGCARLDKDTGAVLDTPSDDDLLGNAAALLANLPDDGVLHAGNCCPRQFGCSQVVKHCILDLALKRAKFWLKTVRRAELVKQHDVVLLLQHAACVMQQN